MLLAISSWTKHDSHKFYLSMDQERDQFILAVVLCISSGNFWNAQEPLLNETGWFTSEKGKKQANTKQWKQALKAF